MIIPARFNGPDRSGNGGYTCGLVAQLIGDGPAEVTLRVPPPLETPLSVVREQDTIKVYAESTLVAEALPVPPLTGAVPGVPLAEAATASRSYPGFTDHPFPACYVCGPQRPRDDGLRVFPGRLPDGRTAAPLRTPADVSPATIWAALDCPGGWTVIGGGAPAASRPYVLGRMAAQVTALPRPGDECVVVGACEAVEGRKAAVASSLYGPGGELLATARATWLAVRA